MPPLNLDTLGHLVAERRHLDLHELQAGLAVAHTHNHLVSDGVAGALDLAGCGSRELVAWYRGAVEPGGDEALEVWIVWVRLGLRFWLAQRRAAGEAAGKRAFARGARGALGTHGREALAHYRAALFRILGKVAASVGAGKTASRRSLASRVGALRACCWPLPNAWTPASGWPFARCAGRPLARSAWRLLTTRTRRSRTAGGR